MAYSIENWLEKFLQSFERGRKLPNLYQNHGSDATP